MPDNQSQTTKSKEGHPFADDPLPLADQAGAEPSTSTPLRKWGVAGNPNRWRSKEQAIARQRQQDARRVRNAAARDAYLKGAVNAD